MAKRLLTYKCGHQVVAVARLTAEEYEEALIRYSRQSCLDCRDAQRDPAEYVYDARVGARISREASDLVARISADPTAVRPKPDYAPEENVHDDW